ncbi:agmatinase family protein [Brevibacillus massiliensis]|jgi:formiminoglutamase|uniref:agmatinase family protein n=1 Tax=Brevibacillus massiliensis TaxID=1118054 RepID=UPI00031884D6|nr:agmatinase family protein [Brevibacillus massiliensis]
MSQFTFIQKPAMIHTPGKSDPYVTRVSEWIEQDWSWNGTYDLGVVGIPLSKSSISFSGAHSHPAVFRQLWSAFTTYNWDEDIDLKDLKAADFGDVTMHITDILQCHQNIEEGVVELVQRFPSLLPIFVGGDHSITYPIVKGLMRARQQRIGLIHFDAHLDVRDTLYGGPSNGTPMRSLIETQAVQGEDIVTLGLRSFANSKEYREYAEGKGMKLFTQKQVKQQGLANLVTWAMEYLGEKCDAVYVTFDIDVMDQSVVPGVPAIGPNGLTAAEIFESAAALGQWEKTLAMDMVCVDPTKDTRDITTRVSVHTFLHFLTGYYKRVNR